MASPNPTFNLADLFEIAVDALGDRLAVVAGDARLTYVELDARANRVCQHLVDAGFTTGTHVGVLAWNRVEWLEIMLGAFKARMVPINLNYRYTADEIAYVLDDAGAAVLFAEASFVPLMNAAQHELATLKHVVVLDDNEADHSDFDGCRSIRYEQALGAARPDRLQTQRSPDDRYLLYTGGTTGAPKGVVWRGEDLFFAALAGGNPGGRPISTPDALATALAPEREPWLVTSPLMHGNGQWNSLVPLLTGRGAVIWTGRRFDALSVARLAADEQAFLLVLVGDGMALPMVDALEQSAGELDLTNLRMITSGGAPLTPRLKQRLHELLPRVTVVDGFGASELGSSGRMVGRGGDGPPRFAVGSDTTVLDDDLEPAAVGDVGRIGRSGHVPLGYWNDPAKTAETFPTDATGTRWAVPGDLARMEEDGTITLLGRGSTCINTGGEKVHPEEVATALKTHGDIFDAIVVGAPDERLGQTVAAIVTVRPDADIDLETVRSHLRPLLAGYKAPRRLLVVDELRYTPQAKPDLQWASEQIRADQPTAEQLSTQR